MKTYPFLILPLLLIGVSLTAAEEDVPQTTLSRYTHPGIVAFREGQWLGSDHLLNVPDKISVVVEISKPEDVVIPVTGEMLTKNVEAVFEKAGITPSAERRPGKPDLPFLHILAMLYPIKDGYSFSLVASLYEEVNLPRINLDEDVTMQAITWDRQSINIASKNKIAEELVNGVDEMVSSFVERYKFFEALKTKS